MTIDQASAHAYGPPRRLKDDAYDHLREAILQGRIAPGTILSEREIAAELKMSKTPVKAALERLEEQGFLTISPQRGAILLALSPKQISEHYDLRIALESFVVSRLSGHLSPLDAERLETILAEQRKYVEETREWGPWTLSDFEFHYRMAAALGNSEIRRIMRLQRDRFRWLVQSIARQDPSVPPISCAEHQGILEAVRDGDAEAARELTVRHLENGKKFLLIGGPYGE